MQYIHTEHKLSYVVWFGRNWELSLCIMVVNYSLRGWGTMNYLHDIMHKANYFSCDFGGNEQAFFYLYIPTWVVNTTMYSDVC